MAYSFASRGGRIQRFGEEPIWAEQVCNTDPQKYIIRSADLIGLVFRASLAPELKIEIFWQLVELNTWGMVRKRDVEDPAETTRVILG